MASTAAAAPEESPQQQPLPAGWTQHGLASKTFYYHAATETVQHERPTSPEEPKLEAPQEVQAAAGLCPAAAAADEEPSAPPGSPSLFKLQQQPEAVQPQQPAQQPQSAQQPQQQVLTAVAAPQVAVAQPQTQVAPTAAPAAATAAASLRQPLMPQVAQPLQQQQMQQPMIAQPCMPIQMQEMRVLVPSPGLAAGQQMTFPAVVPLGAPPRNMVITAPGPVMPGSILTVQFAAPEPGPTIPMPTVAVTLAEDQRAFVTSWVFYGTACICLPCFAPLSFVLWALTLGWYFCQSPTQRARRPKQRIPAKVTAITAGSFCAIMGLLLVISGLVALAHAGQPHGPPHRPPYSPPYGPHHGHPQMRAMHTFGQRSPFGPANKEMQHKLLLRGAMRQGIPQQPPTVEEVMAAVEEVTHHDVAEPHHRPPVFLRLRHFLHRLRYGPAAAAAAPLPGGMPVATLDHFAATDTMMARPL